MGPAAGGDDGDGPAGHRVGSLADGAAGQDHVVIDSELSGFEGSPADGAASSALSSYPIMYNEIFGIVNQTQVMYSRSGANLQLNPLHTPGFDQSVVPTYETFFSDTWHVRGVCKSHRRHGHLHAQLHAGSRPHTGIGACGLQPAQPTQRVRDP